MKQIKAWGLVEKQGARKDRLLTMDYVPFWHPIKSAMFVTKGDAISYMRQARLEDKLRIVRLTITIDKDLSNG